MPADLLATVVLADVALSADSNLLAAMPSVGDVLVSDFIATHIAHSFGEVAVYKLMDQALELGAVGVKLTLHRLLGLALCSLHLAEEVEQIITRGDLALRHEIAHRVLAGAVIQLVRVCGWRGHGRGRSGSRNIRDRATGRDSRILVVTQIAGDQVISTRGRTTRRLPLEARTRLIFKPTFFAAEEYGFKETVYDISAHIINYTPSTFLK